MSVKAAEAKDKKEEQPEVSDRPLTTRLFDAIFPVKRK